MTKIKFKIYPSKLLEDFADNSDFVVLYNPVTDNVATIIDKLAVQIYDYMFDVEIDIPVWANKDMFERETIKSIIKTITEAFTTGKERVTFDYDLIPVYSHRLTSEVLEKIFDSGSSLIIDIKNLKKVL